MPKTALTFFIGTAALIAVPVVTSGWYSKEAILHAAHAHGGALFFVGAFTAFLTAFYMTRLCVVAFLGSPRDHGAEHAHEVPMIMLGSPAHPGRAFAHRRLQLFRRPVPHAAAGGP